MDDDGISPLQAPPLPARREFDEEAYLYLHPDIADGVARGKIDSGWRHFAEHGRTEGRRWLARPDPLLGVIRDIASGDEMFRGNEDHYFDVGLSALHGIETALAAVRRPKSTIRRVLDLPCGHGRVLRFLRRAFPAAELTACDLNRDGVAFCAREFGAIPVPSRVEVDAIPLHGEYDLIWCGSLLTHLSKERCEAFLRLFQRRLARGGILVFTTHGRLYGHELAAGINPHGIADGQIPGLVRAYGETGFGYVDYPGQTGYGFSLTDPSFVTKTLLAGSGCRLIGYHETGWDKRQDVISLQKE